MKTKKLTLTAIFAAFAIALSTLENLVPIGALIPVPGLRLGIANLAVMSAYYIIGRKYAFFVGIIKVFTVFFTFGNITSLFISLIGTIAAFLSLLTSERLNFRLLSFIGVSVFSAVCHALGQITGASLLTCSSAPFSLLLPLGLCSIGTGALTGFVMNCIYPTVRSRTNT